jgi:hypothetical protein
MSLCDNNNHIVMLHRFLILCYVFYYFAIRDSKNKPLYES